jgi:hypothetical protein
LEYFFDPELNIAVVMLDMFNEELLYNNNRHLKFLSMEVQLAPAADLHKMLSQCQRPDKPSVMINGVEYITKLNDVMYQVSNHKQTMLPLALIDRGANCTLFIFKVSMTT